jgi:hypothetical protein
MTAMLRLYLSRGFDIGGKVFAGAALAAALYLLVV